MCGILELSGGNTKVFSFFNSSHCSGSRVPNQGETVITNARLLDGESKVPFLSSAVWREGEVLEDHLQKAIMEDEVPR